MADAGSKVADPLDEPEEDVGSTIAESIQPLETSRLLPRVSFRTALLGTTGMAVLFAIARRADQGGTMAIAVVVAVGYVAVFVALMLICFIVAWLFGSLIGRKDPDLLKGSPFASDQLPPQWIQPSEKEA